MLCLKCGNEIKDNEQICSHCGYNKDTISNTDNPFGVRNQGIYNPNPVDKEAVAERLEHQKEFKELVEIYIGPKCYNFQKGSFSWCAFLLGPLYFLYRKLYAVGIILMFMIGGIDFFFTALSPDGAYISKNIEMLSNLRGVSIYFIIKIVVLLVFQLFLGITFKKFYYNECIERVGKIKQKNPDLGFNQLTQLVKEKGGTNILAPILAVIIPIILIVLLLIITVYLIGAALF